MTESDWDVGLGIEMVGEGRQQGRQVALLKRDPSPAGDKGRGYKGDFTLLHVLGTGKTHKASSSHPEGQGTPQHQCKCPTEAKRD